MTLVTERPSRSTTRRARARRTLRLPRQPTWLRLPRAPQQLSTGTVVTAWVLAILSLIAGWLVLYSLVASSLQARHDQGLLYSQFRERLANQTAPLGGQITPGRPVALISMPSAGLRDMVIVEGTAAQDLENGPGHRRDTALPGQAGVAVVYGRSVLFGGPFQHITSARPGDAITVTTGQGVARFTVQDVRRAGDPFPPALQAGQGRLTLVTSESSGWRDGWAPSHVVYVDAALTGKAWDAPAGRPLAVPRAETAMHGDVGTLYLLVLWLLLLAAGGGVVVWAQERWGRRQTWIVGVPVVLAALWGTSQAAVQLLPNLM